MQRERSDRMRGRRALRTVLVAFVLSIGCGFRPSNANAVIFVALGGASKATGGVGDQLSGHSKLIGGILYMGFGDRTYATLGVRFASFDSPQWKNPSYVTADMGVTYYLVDHDPHRFRPYLAGQVGTGRLRWDYSASAQTVTGVPQDSIVLFYIAPEVGLDLKVTDRLDVRGATRALLTLYDHHTKENINWQINGGDILEVYVGIAVRL